MQTKRLYPVKGEVRFPNSARKLPEKGLRVKLTPYWVRLLKRGIVSEFKPEKEALNVSDLNDEEIQARQENTDALESTPEDIPEISETSLKPNNSRLHKKSSTKKKVRNK